MKEDNQSIKGEAEKAPCLSQTAIPSHSSLDADLTGKTMSAYPYAFTNDDGILVFRAEFLVCEPCVKLEGQMCRTPECVFCFQDVRVARAVLNKTLNCPIIDGERLILLPHTQDTESALRGHNPELSQDSPASLPESASSSETLTEIREQQATHSQLFNTERYKLLSDGGASMRKMLNAIDTLLSIIDSLQAERDARERVTEYFDVERE